MFSVVDIERLDVRRVVDNLIHPLLLGGSVNFVALLLLEYAVNKDGFGCHFKALSSQDDIGSERIQRQVDPPSRY